ncbi:uncharacterized protein LOC143632229 [Bidens hawaiensis]|uniref:uncharacterized protein LOC143632229 n=1 Tax=Bidens hawaiensis TaxID=980011 RepID=UPI00404A7A11
METFKGGNTKQWAADCGLAEELDKRGRVLGKQKEQLEVRRKYVAKILFSDVNVMREMLLEDMLEYHRLSATEKENLDKTAPKRIMDSFYYGLFTYLLKLMMVVVCFEYGLNVYVMEYGLVCVGCAYVMEYGLTVYVMEYGLVCVGCVYVMEYASTESFTLSSFTYGRTVLRPYDWRYIRVDLPTWFSLVTISLESDVDLDRSRVMMADKSNLPMICAREGSPPLPGTYNTSDIGFVLDPISNGSLAMGGLQFSEKCYPMQKNITITLTNEQISPGVWYFGLFNGIGSARTQSKMINRGSGYSFSGNVSVEGCLSPSISGQFCNETIEHLSCVDQNSTQGIITSCRNVGERSCIRQNESKLYSLDLLGVTEEIIISTNVIFNQTQIPIGANKDSNIILMCYARHGSVSSPSAHDYSGNINNAPLVIRSPKVGRWYIMVTSLNTSKEVTRSTNVCYSLEWKLLQCPIDKAGSNCTWERYTLQTIMRKNPSTPFESYYLPASDKVSSNSPNFPLEPLLSNSSLGQSQGQHFGWTYFLVGVPSGASGGSIHIRLNSDKNIKHEIYASYGGLPIEDKWDYFYANSSSNSNGSMFFKLYDSDVKMVSFYIVYVRGGTWGFGVKHLMTSVSNASESQSQTTMSISIERCPRRCSSHGTCQNIVDMSGLSLYSYCWCDRTHGGFDCSVQIVSHREHIWQSVSLIASNAAFAFPAYWALRQKAFAEWVIYTSSGISSGLYHACDVGTWCALSFRVLQFMDFWLSFMAVVSTFVYLADIDEGSKRTIHTVVAILTALMAENGPTRSSNIVLVLAIGAAGLLVGFLIEFFRRYRRFSFSTELLLNMLHSWQTVKDWFRNLIKTILKRFRWFFVVAGFAALAMAAISWNLESTESYWFWHSMWHVSIYTSSFLFIFSKVNGAANVEPGNTNYELTR